MPILVLSARHSDVEKVALLDAGADDYLTKPFSTVEFQARMCAQLRRALLEPRISGETRIGCEDVVADLSNRTVTRNGDPAHLTPTEWDVLRTLVGMRDVP